MPPQPQPHKKSHLTRLVLNRFTTAMRTLTHKESHTFIQPNKHLYNNNKNVPKDLPVPCWRFAWMYHRCREQEPSRRPVYTAVPHCKTTPAPPRGHCSTRGKEGQLKVGWLLKLCILATSKVISQRVVTCRSVHSWWLYSAALLGNQATSTMTKYPTQSHYPDTVLTSPCPVLIMPKARLESDEFQFYKSLVWLDWKPNSLTPTCEPPALPIRPPRLVKRKVK